MNMIYMNSLHFLAAFAVFALIVLYCTKKESTVKTPAPPGPTPAGLINVLPNPYSRYNANTQPLPTQNILDIPKSFDTPQDITYNTQWGTSNTKNA